MSNTGFVVEPVLNRHRAISESCEAGGFVAAAKCRADLRSYGIVAAIDS